MTVYRPYQVRAQVEPVGKKMGTDKFVHFDPEVFLISRFERSFALSVFFHTIKVKIIYAAGSSALYIA